MDYVYVENIYDHIYCSPPPFDEELSSGDIPEEELEMRVIVDCWYETGLMPLIHAQENNLDTHQHEANFQRLTQTLTTLIRCRAYQSALQRIVSVSTRNPLEREYLGYLLHQNVSPKQPNRQI